jgi:hypothetical protein
MHGATQITTGRNSAGRSAESVTLDRPGAK